MVRGKERWFLGGGGKGKGKGKAKRDLICLYFTVRTKNHTKRVFLLLFRDRVDT